MDFSELETEIRKKLLQCERILTDSDGIIQIHGSKRLRTRIKAELQFLSRLLKEPSKIKKEHLRSTNMPHLEAMLSCIVNSENVVEILKPVPWTDGGGVFQQIVDVVADFGATWIKIVARNPQALLRSSLGAGSYGKRTLIQQVGDLNQCANHHHYLYQPPRIKVWFTNGVTSYLLSALNKLNVEPTGNIMELEDDCEISEFVSSDSESDSTETNSRDGLKNQSDINPACAENKSTPDTATGKRSSIVLGLAEIPKASILNIDVSTMICYVSNLTNGMDKFVFQDAILTEQAERERSKPVKPILDSLFKNRQLVCCRLAYDDFQEILSVVGGPQERARASQLLKRVRLVDDQLSDKAIELKVSCKIKQRARVVFGTGDAIQAITVTANQAFMRAAEAQGLHFVCFLHESRALTEMKEHAATIFTAK